MTDQTTTLKKLREAFAPEAISKLPKGVSKEGQPQNCDICHGYHKRASLHLDYVGHAAVTQRLLDVDPLWTWEPFAFDEQGLPALDRDHDRNPIGLWIRLTVGGMTRIGYGSVESAKSDAVKELIGDAIRNGAMRFGVALDLWHKGELPEPPDPDEQARQTTNALKTLALELTGDRDKAKVLWAQTVERFSLNPDDQVTPEQYEAVLAELKVNHQVSQEPDSPSDDEKPF